MGSLRYEVHPNGAYKARMTHMGSSIYKAHPKGPRKLEHSTKEWVLSPNTAPRPDF